MAKMMAGVILILGSLQHPLAVLVISKIMSLTLINSEANDEMPII